MSATEFGLDAKRCLRPASSPKRTPTGIGPPGWKSHPHEGWGGGTTAAAVMRLLRAHGISVALVEADCDPAHPERQVFRLKREVCPDCGGGGKYVGLSVVETCGTCGGSGAV